MLNIITTILNHAKKKYAELKAKLQGSINPAEKRPPLVYGKQLLILMV